MFIVIIQLKILGFATGESSVICVPRRTRAEGRREHSVDKEGNFLCVFICLSSFFTLFLSPFFPLSLSFYVIYFLTSECLILMCYVMVQITFTNNTSFIVSPCHSALVSGWR